MENIIPLNVAFQFDGKANVIHPVVLQDDENMVLVDCGYTGFLPLVEREMAANGLDCRRLTHIVITHQDHDHMGALYDFKMKYPKAQVVASETEAPYIAGNRKFLRLEQAQERQAGLPESEKEFGLAFCRMLQAVKPVAVDRTVRDGEELGWCGGCTVIATPGHMPGHISLYLSRKNVLLAGDAAVVENGEPAIANPQYTLDMEQARQSLKKLLRYGADEIICYHGGVWKARKKEV